MRRARLKAFSNQAQCLGLLRCVRAPAQRWSLSTWTHPCCGASLRAAHGRAAWPKRSAPALSRPPWARAASPRPRPRPRRSSLRRSCSARCPRCRTKTSGASSASALRPRWFLPTTTCSRATTTARARQPPSALAARGGARPFRTSSSTSRTCRGWTSRAGGRKAGRSCGSRGAGSRSAGPRRRRSAASEPSDRSRRGSKWPWGAEAASSASRPRTPTAASTSRSRSTPNSSPLPGSRSSTNERDRVTHR
mmetsp:Transcript_2685/g.9780  ORF Transcript_2685/g.9780 Transcript_2685/m.9780 type:complete len:250 (+) Transcript_2685:983-1732(+)